MVALVSVILLRMSPLTVLAATSSQPTLAVATYMTKVSSLILVTRSLVLLTSSLKFLTIWPLILMVKLTQLRLNHFSRSFVAASLRLPAEALVLLVAAVASLSTRLTFLTLRLARKTH